MRTKAHWLAVAVGGLVFAAEAQSAAGVLSVASGVSCSQGTLRLAWASKPLLDESFAHGAENWKIENYNNALKINAKREGERTFLSVSREGETCDTAFCLCSPDIDVAPDELFELSVSARGSEAFARPRGSGTYPMNIQWLAADGQPVAAPLAFGLRCCGDAWSDTRVAGRVPAGALRAVVRLGADVPNIVQGRPLDVARVVFAEQTPGENGLSGEAVSRPFRLTDPGASPVWDAECPADTGVALHLSFAPDDHGAPGAWSPFVGPDGTAASAFVRPGQRLPALPETARWLRYRVRLTSAVPTRSPVVRRVAIGAFEDRAWSGADETPPTLEVCSPKLTPNAAAPIVFRLTDPVGISGATLHFWVDGREETARLRREGETFRYEPAAPFVAPGAPRGSNDAPPNLHELRVSVEDQAGNRLAAAWPLLVGGEQSSSDRVALRKDGTVLVGGRPFFPIGIYAVWKKAFNGDSFDRAFEDLKTNGFNVAHTYNNARGEEFRAFMDAAARHGIRLFLASGQGANCADARAVLEDVARERRHPALLAWYLADDTVAYMSPQQLTALSDAVRAIDPDHITVQADTVGADAQSNYGDFVGATDGFLPELYPIRGDDDVPQIITDMQRLRADLRAAGNPVKTVWPIIQYFEGWGWPRFPTPDELRAMSFLALIHGANGITWYTYGGHGDNHGATHTDATWRTMCHVAKEMSALQDVLLSETCEAPRVTVVAGPEKDRQGHAAISVLAKRFRGKLYLLCANSAKNQVDAAIALPGVKKVADEQDSARACTFKDNVLADTFPPYGVRVYVAE